jgi:hypothetical protein
MTGVDFEEAMSMLNTVELKVFVPARDFELSMRFYQDLESV